jgi:hypothetical protein
MNTTNTACGGITTITDKCDEEQLRLVKGINLFMSVVALSMSKVMWLVKGARNCVVVAAKARP